MANIKQSKYPKNVNDVERDITNGKAHIGVVAYKTDGNSTKPFLIITDANNDVVDVQPIDNGINGIQLSKPTLIIDSTSNVNGHIQNGYYEPSIRNGEYSTIVSAVENNGKDASQDILHDDNFGRNRGVIMSGHTRQMIYDRAMSMLDNPQDMNSAEIASYLNRTVEMYDSYAKKLPDHDSKPDMQIEQIEKANREWDTIIRDTGVNGFESRVRFMANEVNNEHYQNFLKDYDVMQSRAYVNQLERAEADRKYDIVQMNAKYNEHSQTILREHSELLAQDGLTSQIGSHSETSLKAIRAAIENQQHRIDVALYTEETPSVVSKRLNYLKELTALEQNHPAMLANMNSSGKYHFIADQNIYASINDNIGGHSRTASESFEHAFVLYKGDLSQREYYDYLLDKSKVIQALAFNDEKKTNEYYQIYSKSEGMPEEQRLDLVRNELKNRLSISESSHVNEFLHSHEFETIMRDRSTLYATTQTATGKAYISWNDNSTSYSTQTTSPGANPSIKNLAPAYSVLLSSVEKQGNTLVPVYDLSTKEGCEKYQQAISLAMQREAKIHDRPSQELLTQQRFIEEYVKYNELSQTANRVRIFTNDLNKERIEYSDATLGMLNGEQHRATAKTIDYLKQHNFDIDFKSMPTTQQMHQNYESLANGFDKILVHSTNDLQSTLSNCKGLTNANTDSIETRANRLCDKVEDINASNDLNERAKKIAEAMGYSMSSTISKTDVEKINEEYNKIKPMLEEINRPDLDLRSQAKLLSDRLSIDMQHEVQVTRGCDNLYARNPKTSSFTSSNEADMASAKRLDFATAIAHSELPAKEAALEVVANHSIRNNLIDKIEKKMESEKMETFQNLLEIKDVINDPNAKNRTEQIAAALGINVENSRNKDKIIDIMRSNDFENEVKRMLLVAEKERINASDSPYFVRLEKTNGLDNYKTIINESNGNINYSMLGNKGYIEYISSQTPQNSSVHVSADKLIEKNNYMEMLVVTRNLEDIVHRTNASEEEIKRAKQLAEDYAFVNAVEARDVDTKIRIVKYQDMINEAADQNHWSAHAKNKVEDTYQTVGTEAKALERILDKHFSDDILKTSTRVATDDQAIGRHSQDVINAIKNDEDFYKLRGEIEHKMRSNPHYKEMVEHNHISHTQARINEIDKKIDVLTLYKNTREAIKAEHEQQLFGRGKVEVDNVRIKEWERQISQLKEERSRLVNSMQTTMEHTEHRRAAFETFKNEPNVDNATKVIKDALQTHGSDTLNRMNVTRHIKLPNYTEKEFLEASSKVTVPACNAETFQRARQVLADDAIQKSTEHLEQIRLRRIEEIKQELAPKATHTEITPEVVNKLIIPTAQADLAAATTKEEKAVIQNQINRYEALSKELATLQSVDVKQDTFSFYRCAHILAKYDSSVASSTNTYDLAKDTKIDAEKKSAKFEEMQDLRAAYRHLNIMREQRETLSQNELDNAVQYNYKNQHTITVDDIKNALANNKLNDSHKQEKIDRLASALDAVSKREPQINELMNKINNGHYDRLDKEELRTLAIIREYNEASRDIYKNNLSKDIVDRVIQFKNDEIRSENIRAKEIDPKATEIPEIRDNLASNKKLVEDITLKPIRSHSEEGDQLTAALAKHNDKLDVINNSSSYVTNYELASPEQRSAYVAKFCNFLTNNMKQNNNIEIEVQHLTKDDQTVIAFAAMATSQYSNNELQTLYTKYLSNDESNANGVILFPKDVDVHEWAMKLTVAKEQNYPAVFNDMDANEIYSRCKVKCEDFGNRHPNDPEFISKCENMKNAENMMDERKKSSPEYIEQDERDHEESKGKDNNDELSV